MIPEARFGYVGLVEANHLVLRQATLADAAYLLMLRNDRETRRQSIKQGRVSKIQHARWLRSTLKSADTLLLVIRHGGADIGAARLDCKLLACEASLMIEAVRRGEGFMAPAIEALKAEARRRGYTRIRAQVRQNNVRSLRGFLRTGFVPVSDELMTLKCKL